MDGWDPCVRRREHDFFVFIDDFQSENESINWNSKWALLFELIIAAAVPREEWPNPASGWQAGGFHGSP